MTSLTALGVTALSIPSPSNGVWHLGPLPIRGYALSIIVGIIFAIWFGERRWVARGGAPGQVQDLAVWAVPFGLVGARLYHVMTDWKKYFGDGENPVTALYVWHGGLGIWGAVIGGAVGVWWWARRKGVHLPAALDVLAPGLIVAQAFGRWGNWFNQELYGKPTDLPWGLEIDSLHYPSGLSFPVGTTFHPTFLYECLWNLGVFALLLWAERRYRLGHGRLFAMYVMGYTLGRGWIEYLRIDTVQLNDVLGLRLNVWTSIVLFTAALVYFVLKGRSTPGQEPSLYRDGDPATDVDAADDYAGADADDESEAESTPEDDADTDVSTEPLDESDEVSEPVALDKPRDA